MSGMASFLAGFGGGYLKADRQKTQDERQAKLDAQNEQIFNWKKDEVDRENKYRTSMQDAFAKRTVEQGTVTEANMGEGAPMQRMFTKDPGQAAALKETLDAEAELSGMGPSTQQQGTAITGAMTQGHEIKTGQAPTATMGMTPGTPAPAGQPPILAKMADPNSPEEQNKRALQAMRAHGKWDKAVEMESSLLKMQADKLGLDVAQATHAKTLFNERLNKALSSKSTPEDGIAHALSETEQVLPGEKVVWRDGKDGKADYFAVGQDGAERPVFSLAKGAEGKKAFIEMAGQASLFDQIKYVNEGIKAKQDADKLAAEIKVKNAQAAYYESAAKAKNTGGGSVRGGTGEAGATAIGLKDRRDMLDDFSGLLPKPDNPETIQSNAKFLQQADAIFSDNAQFGAVLTAPQVMAATQLAADPKNIKLVQDQQTGKTYQTVAVSGKRVIVGMATQKQPDQSPPQTVQTTQAAKPTTRTMSQVVEKPAYVPPANSPAGKAAANREAMALQSMQKMQATRQAALAAIQSGDPSAADEVRGMPGFMSLPREQKAQLQKIIFGR